MALDVRFRSQDNTLYHRGLDLRLTSQTTLHTPTRGIDANLARRSPIAVKGPVFYEYYKRPDGAKMDRVIHDKGEELAYSYGLNSAQRTAGENPLLVLQDFDEPTYPQGPQLQFLIRTAHAYSDILVLPLVSRMTDHMDSESGFENYLKFLEEVTAILHTYNQKPVMGVVPLKTPFIRIGELVRFYARKGIRALCLDYATMKPDTPRQAVEQVAFSLAEEGLLKETFVYAINVSSGRPRITTDVSPSHSILSYGFGCDGFGDLHRSRMKIDEGEPPRVSPIRLFSRKDYGEHKVERGDEAEALRPEETSVDLRKCAEDKRLAKLYNAEQHSLEARHIQPLIETNKDSPGVESYLKRKAHVGGTQLRLMRALVAAIAQRELPRS